MSHLNLAPNTSASIFTGRDCRHAPTHYVCCISMELLLCTWSMVDPKDQQMLFLLLDYGNECQWKLGLLCNSLTTKSVTYIQAFCIFIWRICHIVHLYWPDYIFILNIGLFIKKSMNPYISLYLIQNSIFLCMFHSFQNRQKSCSFVHSIEFIYVFIY